jgi:ubiquitin-like domain-containing CTD phosphatase 1
LKIEKGMGPLWSEIMSNILPIVDPTNHPMSSSGTPPPKLGLFSGHDTTLMPILATLGDKVWPGTEWSP